MSKLEKIFILTAYNSNVETCHGASHCDGICGEKDFEV